MKIIFIGIICDGSDIIHAYLIDEHIGLCKSLSVMRCISLNRNI